MTVIMWIVQCTLCIWVLFQKGNTSLHIASLAGHIGIVRVLVQNGAQVNIQSQVCYIKSTFHVLTKANVSSFLYIYSPDHFLISAICQETYMIWQCYHDTCDQQKLHSVFCNFSEAAWGYRDSLGRISNLKRLVFSSYLNRINFKGWKV